MRKYTYCTVFMGTVSVCQLFTKRIICVSPCTSILSYRIEHTTDIIHITNTRYQKWKDKVKDSYLFTAITTHDFPRGSTVKYPPANTGDTNSITRSGRSPGGGNGNPLQYSCLENPMDRGAWQATVHGVI